MNKILSYAEMTTVVESLLRPIYSSSELNEKLVVNRIQRFGFDPKTLKPIAVDGVPGPKTMGAVYYNPLLLQEKPNTRVALVEILMGSQEIGGSNMGPFVRKYFRLKKDPEKNVGPYCAGGASFCLDAGYEEDDTPYIVGAQRLGKAVADKGILKDKSLKERRLEAKLILPGDLVIYERITDTPGTGHVGTCILNDLEDQRLVTVDFNVGAFPAPTRLFVQKGQDKYAQGSDSFLFGARWK